MIQEEVYEPSDEKTEEIKVDEFLQEENPFDERFGQFLQGPLLSKVDSRASKATQNNDSFYDRHMSLS